MLDDPPPAPFFLIVADHVRGFFAVEGPMTDDRPWNDAAASARAKGWRVVCGPAGPDRDALAAEFRNSPIFTVSVPLDPRREFSDL